MKTYIEPHMRTALTGHTLTPLVRDEGARIEVWRMARAGTRAMSVQIAGTPEGICLMGDLHPGPDRNGCCSVFGRGLRWFSQEQMSESDLCSKFLTRAWVPEIAAETLRRWGANPGDYGLEACQAGTIRVLATRVHDCDERQFYDALTELGLDDGDGIPGYGYPPEDAGWLCAIQERFSALYRER